MIRVNLLPHREMRRERRKREFFSLLAATGVAAVVCTLFVGFTINQLISAQESRNAFLKSENTKLDEQIKEIATLRSEIESLKARQQAVENLQADRTIPVHLLDELVRQVPEGIFLRQLKQDDLRVSLSGIAQSNERVSELLRNIAYNAGWLEKPELGEIKLAPPDRNAKDSSRRVYEFTVNALLKRQVRPDDKPAPKTVSSVGGQPAGPMAAAAAR